MERIYAVSVNAADYRSMQLGFVPKKIFFGADVTGVVEAVGKNVKNLRIGDVVFGGSISQIIKTLLFGSILSIGGKRMQVLSAKSNVKDLEFVVKLVEDRKIKPVIDRRYQLHETSDAIIYIKQGHAQGKVVISVHY